METYGTDVGSPQWDPAFTNHDDLGNYLAGDYSVHQQTFDYGYSSDSASYTYSEYQDCGGQLSPATTVASSSSSSPVPATFTYTFEQQQCDYNMDPNTALFSDVPSTILNLPTKKLPGKKQQPMKAMSAAVWAKRRLDANARERKRMTGLNGAFTRLRAVLCCTRDRPLSKMEALQTAQQRIAELRKMLEAVKN